MNYVKRMVLKAMRHKDLRDIVNADFSAFNCLNASKDWDWGYEVSKGEFVRQAISDEHLSYGVREARWWFRKNDREAFWYPEWQRLAKRILRKWKESRR